MIVTTNFSALIEIDFTKYSVYKTGVMIKFNTFFASILRQILLKRHNHIIISNIFTILMQMVNDALDSPGS